MILRRLGNKKKIAKKIQAYFPPHEVYIEPFFGAGGMFFNKPKVKYNIVNDLDGDVFNLFQIVINQKEELEKAFFMMPIHSDLLEYWGKNLETDPIKKALRFLFLSNFTYLGKMDTIKFGSENPKNTIYNNLDSQFKLINDVQFTNFDFKKFLNCFGIRDKNKCFIYADPPYIGTTDNYNNSFKESDSIDLFDALEAKNFRFAYSEFNNEFILDQAKQRGLNIIEIGERQNLKNRRTEILITNYENRQTALNFNQ